MIIGRNIVLILAASCLIHAGEANSKYGRLNERSPNVEGQTVQDDTRFTWQAFLVNTRHQSVCGGSIISDTYILTAAHCVYGASASDVKVYVGLKELSLYTLAGQTKIGLVEISDIKIHESYDESSLGNDIALLKVKTAIQLVENKVSSILLSTVPYTNYVGQFLTAIGWGVTPTDFYAVLKYADVEVMSEDSWWGMYGWIQDNTLCVSWFTRSICQGESGGSLVKDVGPGMYELVGVSSFTESPCQRHPAGFADVYFFRSWIISNSQ